MDKPGDFYIGITSFLSILLPGSIATVLLQTRLLRRLDIDPFIAVPESTSARWAAFLITAYFVGHIVFLIGSYLDPFYDRIRKKRSYRREERINERAFQSATQIRDEILRGPEAEAVSTFQWSRAILSTQFPHAANDVHELEAASKFFRSLFVLLSMGGVILLIEAEVIAAVVSLALASLCFARYYERRLKSTTQAYVYAITLHRLGKLSSSAGLSNGALVVPES
jgi:hypothetical protein